MSVNTHELNEPDAYDWEDREEGLARARAYFALGLLGFAALIGGVVGFMLGAFWGS